MPFELIPEKAPEPEEESYLGTAVRGAARTGARVAEQVAGFPGDILSLVNEFIAKPVVETATGKPGVSYEETPLGKILPTSQQLKKGNIKQAGKILEPQNKIEGFIDNLVGDATSIFVPGQKESGLLKKVGSSLFKAVGANVAKEAVQDLTADEKKGAYAHLGALTLLSFVDKKGAAKAISEGYQPLQEKAVRLAPVSANKLENNLNLLKQKMQKGTGASSEQFIIDEVDKVLGKINRGQITPEEAWAAKRSLNEKMSEVLFKIPKKENQQRARSLAHVISHELDDTLKQTHKQDPNFYKELKGWNNAYKTMADSNFVSKWVENNLKYSPATVGLLHLMGNPITTKASAAVAPYEVGKVLYRISKSPKLAKHYMKTLGAAASEDAVLFNRQLKLLDKDLKNEEKKDRFILLED